jgi:formate--tetrahydrofolate ligase
VGNLRPDAVVLVATIPALKLHGGVDKEDIYKENVEAVKVGVHNLLRHVDILRNVYKVPFVVTLNKYASDTKEEIDTVREILDWLKVYNTINDAWGQGGKGCTELADIVKILCEKSNSEFEFAYDLDSTIEKKIKNIATKVYKAKDVVFSEEAKAKIKDIKKLKMSHFPVVIAKTQYSLSDDPKLICSPEDFTITIRDIEIRSGAEFIVAIAGNMMLMPGLSKTPAASKMSIDYSGKISGLF